MRFLRHTDLTWLQAAARHRGICVVCLVCVGALGLRPQSTFAGPPHVTKTVPENGANDVDPNLRELRIEFDRDMDKSGHSICGKGPKFPTLRGPARLAGKWMNRRTFVLSVRLESDHDYELSINCPSAKNFRSADGEPVSATPLRFHTRANGSQPRKASGEANRRALSELQKALDQNYSHIEIHPVDWKARFTDYGPQLERAASSKEFARAAAELLSAAHDLHIRVAAEGETFATQMRRVDPNIDPKRLPRLIPQWQQVNRLIATGRFDDGIGYLFIGDLPSEAAMQPVLDALSEWKDPTGIVIDLRTNAGGDERAARAIAGCFVSQSTPYARHLLRDPNAKSGFSESRTRRVEPNSKVRRPGVRLAVLIGPANMSSAESFVLMLRQVSNARLFGARTYGSSGNPQPTELANGVTVFLPSWIDQQLSGRSIEGNGIEPDVAVPWPKEGLAPGKADPVLSAALEWLRARNGR